ncbi:MAG: Site-determining protein [Desulfotomaculum sp. 46_296]|nr:MAG: Site-determining protein [Desulfotomaculum sp. 46_296]
MPDDQAASLRILAKEKRLGKQKLGFPESGGGPVVIAVTSGKGGVGKTSMVVNLGLLLAKQRVRTVILDADLGLANVEVLVGIVPPYSIYDVLYGNKTFQDILINGPFDLQIVSGGSGLQELANIEQSQRERLISSLAFFQDKTEILLIDTGAGISRNVLGFVAAAGEVIVVVTPEPTSLTDAYSLIKVLAKFEVHERVFFIVNQASSEQEAVLTAERIILVTNKFLRNIKLEYLGFILKDNVVVEAVKNQTPFVILHPNSQATKSLTQISIELNNLIGRKDYLTDFKDPIGMKSFIQKLLRLYK